MSECVKSNTSVKNGIQSTKVISSMSLPAFEILSERQNNSSRAGHTKLRIPRKEKMKSEDRVDDSPTMVEIHRTPGETPHSNGGRRNSSRHERHKCHKSKRKLLESLQITNQNLIERINELKRENYLLSKKLNVSGTSLDSGLSQNEILSPFEVDVNRAYQHVKNENTKMTSELEICRARCTELEMEVEKLEQENRDLNGDVEMLKILVYKLNVELERYQNGGNGGNDEKDYRRKTEILPKNYQKNFLKPVLPLLRAYGEAVQEKSEIIENFESEMKKFNAIFNELLKENEKLYLELERKMSTAEGGALNEVKILKKDLEMAKQENNLLLNQIELEQEKLAEVHSVYRMKVAEVLKQNETVNENLQDNKADLYMMRGKYSILKQEFERLKLENDSRVPMAVHAASIGECKRLFQDLKNEYESQKQHHLATIAEQEKVLTQLKQKYEECTKERDQLEKCNFENETLRRRITEIEDTNRISGKVTDGEKERGELLNIKRQLRDSNTKVEELSSKLSNTKKQLHKAMAFAKDIVREQESLLLQLHAKQKENTLMVTHFGSLRKQLRSVERGAQEGLNSVEEKMKSLEFENSKLVSDMKILRNLLKEKEDLIARLERKKDSTS